MFAPILSGEYDSYHSNNSHNLVNALRSDIGLKLDHEQKTPKFITDLRRKLYFIHEYNCQVAKVTQKYPRSRQLDLLLIKYVELEFEVLYNSNPRPPKQQEIACELRVLRLLQVMLYPAVLNDEPLVNKRTDRLLKRAVLQLLGEVRATYLVKNKLVCNIAHKLLKKIRGDSKRRPSISENKNLAVTSDYGTDDSDSDFEHNIFTSPLFLRYNELDPTDRSSNSDCVEVLPTTNGYDPPKLTFEVTDDDDICYFIYLQKQIPIKRKLQDNEKPNRRKKNSVEASNKTTSFQDQIPPVNSSSDVACIKKNNSGEASNKNIIIQDVLSTAKSNSSKENVQCDLSCSDQQKKIAEISTEACIIVCSDSEDEISEATSRQSNRCKAKSKDKHNQKEKNNSPILTFEILDDDDDDENGYMVYLEKQVETNTKSKKQKEKIIEEITICSNSDDDTDEKTNIFTSEEESLNKARASSSDRQEHEQNTAENDKKSELQNNFMNVPNCDAKLNSETDSLCQKIQTEPTASTSAQVFIVRSDEISPIIQDDCNPNFLVDPGIILEQMTQTHLEKNGEVLAKLNNSSQIDEIPTEASTEDNVFGGPVMSERVDELEDLGNVSECRINESLLEEILLDDNYLLEGRKEFEELEYFLFNDSIGKQGFSLSNFTLDDNETILQPETFHANIESLESFLNDSHLIGVPDDQLSASLSDSESSLGNNGSTNNDKLKLNLACRRLNPEQRVKSTSYNETWKKNRRRARVKDLKTIFEQYKKVNKR